MYGYRQSPSGFKVRKTFGNHGAHLAVQEYGRGTKGITLGAFYTYENKDNIPVDIDTSVGLYQSSRKLTDSTSTEDHGIYARIKTSKAFQLNRMEATV